ncbi:hypothetical protein MUP00_12235 [Candidatus Bathyarchaeota archaeon]|nr:hypothetical protein [Candidatus Bathyarchaeota archaeon]
MGNVNLQAGQYDYQIVLTQESFHGSGGSFAWNWAGAVNARVTFTIED